MDGIGRRVAKLGIGIGQQHLHSWQSFFPEDTETNIGALARTLRRIHYLTCTGNSGILSQNILNNAVRGGPFEKLRKSICSNNPHGVPRLSTLSRGFIGFGDVQPLTQCPSIITRLLVAKAQKANAHNRYQTTQTEEQNFTTTSHWRSPVWRCIDLWRIRIKRIERIGGGVQNCFIMGVSRHASQSIACGLTMQRITGNCVAQLTDSGDAKLRERISNKIDIRTVRLVELRSNFRQRSKSVCAEKLESSVCEAMSFFKTVVAEQTFPRRIRSHCFHESAENFFEPRSIATVPSHKIWKRIAPNRGECGHSLLFIRSVMRTQSSGIILFQPLTQRPSIIRRLGFPKAEEPNRPNCNHPTHCAQKNFPASSHFKLLSFGRSIGPCVWRNDRQRRKGLRSHISVAVVGRHLERRNSRARVGTELPQSVDSARAHGDVSRAKRVYQLRNHSFWCDPKFPEFGCSLRRQRIVCIIQNTQHQRNSDFRILRIADNLKNRISVGVSFLLQDRQEKIKTWLAQMSYEKSRTINEALIRAGIEASSQLRKRYAGVRSKYLKPIYGVIQPYDIASYPAQNRCILRDNAWQLCEELVVPLRARKIALAAPLEKGGNGVRPHSKNSFLRFNTLARLCRRTADHQPLTQRPTIIRRLVVPKTKEANRHNRDHPTQTEEHNFPPSPHEPMLTWEIRSTKHEIRNRCQRSNVQDSPSCKLRRSDLFIATKHPPIPICFSAARGFGLERF